MAQEHDAVVEHVAAAAHEHSWRWRERDEGYWLQRLMQEVGELASVLAGDHTDTVEHELTQVASIAVNWLRRRMEGELAYASWWCSDCRGYSRPSVERACAACGGNNGHLALTPRTQPLEPAPAPVPVAWSGSYGYCSECRRYMGIYTRRGGTPTLRRHRRPGEKHQPRGEGGWCAGSFMPVSTPA
jgi:hypothetical protein